MKVIEVGTRVRAKHTITEDGGDPDPEAEAFEPGFVHAEEGEEGVVESIDMQGDDVALNVRFDRSGILCVVGDLEVEAVQ